MSEISPIAQHMYDNDPFSIWLGIIIEECTLGYCRLTMDVREEMTNGFGIAHGGITFSFADSAFAFASNTYGPKSVSIETTIAHTSPVRAGDKLLAECREVNKSPRIGLYTVVVTNQDDQLVAHFRGTVYRKKEEWELSPN